MSVTISFPRYDERGNAYVTWRPVPVRVAITDEPGRREPLRVTVADNRPASPRAGQGRLLFADHLTHAGRSSVEVDLPADGTPATIWVGGEFPAASSTFGDVVMRVVAPGSPQPVATHPTMVRIRKNANALTTAERDLFLNALAEVNGAGVFADFRDMHRLGAPNLEAHGAAGFLAWHRTYLLDLERELQRTPRGGDVALPYWRFDRAAPNLFAPSFLGLPNARGQVQLTPGNPLVSWVTDNTPGIERGPGVGPQTIPRLRTEQLTIAPGGRLIPTYAGFAGVEADPHGLAHTSHRAGWITNIGTAAKDPLFFLLHCNVDRLWAKWQWATQLHDPRAPAAFDPASTAPGHRLNDRMWPWRGPLPAPRPTTAPGGPLRPSPLTPVPGAQPRVRDMIDYLGTVSPEPLGFAYDDVPFQLVGGRR